MASNKLKPVGKHDRIDLDMVMGLIGNSILFDNGIKQVTGLMQQAKDPTGVMAQLVFHAVGQVRNQLAQKNIPVSNKIWTARRGVVDQSIAEIAKLVAGVSGNNDIINPNVLEGTREQVLDLFHQQSVATGGRGRGTLNDNEGALNQDVNGLPDKSPAEEAAESTEEADSEGDLQGGVMPPGEAGGSHGPNRMPAPIGLLGG